jgi:probable phosphoglycerate mutase
VVVIRHGETLWNHEGRQQGQANSPLSELGIRQAHALKHALAGERFDAIYSSDTERALETARIVAELHAQEICNDAGLRERHLGILQGLTMDEFREKHPGEYKLFQSGDADHAIPGGESRRQRFERVTACASRLVQKHPGGNILMVAHGGVLDSLIRYTVGVPLDAHRNYSLFNASINRFSVTNDTWRLLQWGDISHLKDIGSLDDS